MNSTEYLQYRLQQFSCEGAAEYFAKQRRRHKAHRRHSDLTNITTEIENAALMFRLCDTTLGRKLCG